MTKYLNLLKVLLVILYSSPAAHAQNVFFRWDTLACLPPVPGSTVNPGVGGPFAGVHNGALIIGGGANFPVPVGQNEIEYRKQIYVLPDLDMADRSLWIKSYQLDHPFAYGCSVSLEQGLLCMGGSDKKRVYSTVFLLHWNPASQHLQKQYLPSLPSSCANGYATVLGEKVYLAGGHAGSGLETALKNFWVLDLSGFRPYSLCEDEELLRMAGKKKINVPVAARRSDLIKLLTGQDSLMTCLGEANRGELIRMAEHLAIPTSEQLTDAQILVRIRQKYWRNLEWRQLPPWPGPARAFNITVAQHNGENDCVYVISGRCLSKKNRPDDFEFLTDVYEFNPSFYDRGFPAAACWRKRSDAPGFVMAAPAASVGQSHIFILGGADGARIDRVDIPRDRHPGFPKTIWVYHTITDTWTAAGTMPANQVTTPAVKWDGKIIIPGGEISPRRRSPLIWKLTPLKHRYDFGWTNFTALTIYLLAMVVIGFYFAYRNKNTNDYFRGGQHIPWWAAGCSIFATMLSAITYMSVPAKAYAANWEYLLGYPAIFIVSVFVIFLVLPFFRVIDATSAYEYLEKRFNRLTRLIGSGLFIIFQIGRMAIVMFLSALALTMITPFSEVEAILIMGILSVLYSTLGGVEAVIWTDTMQTFVLLGGALLVFILILFKLEGGFSEFVDIAAAGQKFHMLNWDWRVTSYTTTAFWVIVVGSISQNLISYTSDQAVVQRYMTTANENLAARSILTNGIMALGAGLLFFMLGTALYVFYKVHPAMLDPGFQNDAILPFFMVSELPAGIAGLVVAGIFAAAQSTISTSMNSTATAGVTDFIRPYQRDRDDSYFLKLGRLFTFLFGCGGTLLAVMLAGSDIKSLLEQFFAFIGLFGGSLGGLFLLGIFTTRTNSRGAVTGAASGAVVLYLVQTYTDTHVYLYAFVGVASCFVSGYLASLLSGKPKQSLSGLTVFNPKSEN